MTENKNHTKGDGNKSIAGTNNSMDQIQNTYNQKEEDNGTKREVIRIDYL